MSQEWLYVEHPATGGAGWIPDNPGVLAHHQGRGWAQAVPPVEVVEVGPPEPALEAPEINGPQPGDLEPAGEAEPEVNGPRPTEVGALVGVLNSLARQGRVDNEEEASDLPATDDEDEN